MLNRLPVRRQLLLANVAVVLLIALFAAVYYPAVLQRRTLESRRDEVVNLAETVALGVGIGLGISELPVVSTTFEWARRDPALLCVRAMDVDGFELGSYNPTEIRYADHPGWTGTEPAVTEDRDRMDVAVPISYRGTALGGLHLGVSLASVQDQLRADRRAGLFASAVIFLLGGLLSLVVAARIVRPLESLRAAADRIAGGSLDVRVETHGEDEFAALGREFNSMAGRLNETMDELETARDAALSAVRAKADFLATMSHEIRTPMNGVLGMLDLLRRTELNETQSEYSTTAHNSAEALLGIINDILDFSKIEAGRIDLEAVEFELRDTIEDVCGLLAAGADAKEVELVCIIEDEVPHVVTADEGRLRQVLLNLVGNAIKFTDSGGEVVVEVSGVAIEGDEVRLRFSVRDSGIGIAEDVQESLFQPFQQADASTTRRFGGTGLGLAISRRLVEAMGGEIGLESQRRVGSTFWFDLSIRCTLAEDGPSALATLQAIPDSEIPSLVILDMQMPGMDGLAVAQMLKRDPRTAGMKVILATSLSEVRALEGDSPIDIRLAKPIRQAALHRAIAGLLQPREEARPESAARREPEAIEGEGVSARVLLVEDNPVNQMVAQAMLGQLRHEVEVARNGQEALDALGRSKYDVILMDCQMPVMDGFEATRAIRALDGDVNRIPIVAMTANAMKEDRQRCLDAGMNDYLAKPVSVRDLASVIGRALEGDRTAL